MIDKKIKIILADDHEIFRDGLRMILSNQKNIEIVASVANGEQLVKTTRNLKPDVIITDIKMPVTDGIEATKLIMMQQPQIGIIALSMFDEEDLIVEMLDAGARGYLLKNADKNEIFEAIETVAEGDNFYCKHTSSKLAVMIARSRSKKENKTSEIHFSDREIEVMKYICQELTNKEIADKMYLSSRTIEGYRLKLLEKMQVKNSIGIVIYAIQHGIYDFKPGIKDDVY